MSQDGPRLPADVNVADQSFGAYYYANCCGKPYCRNDEWMAFFGGIADRIVEGIAPGRVLDAGCALGLLVEALRDRGVDAFGIDLSSYAIEHAHEKVKPYCRRASITEEFPDRYDLIVCIEVLEHMPAADAEAAVANICRHTDDVLFSSTPFDHREPTHINVHPPEHWAELLARHGYHRDTDYDASFVTTWAVRFRRSHEPFHRLVRAYERLYADLAGAARDARAYAMSLQDQVEGLQPVRQQTEPLHREIAALRDRLTGLQERVTHLEAEEKRLQNEVNNRRALAEMQRREVEHLRERAARADAAIAEAHEAQTRRAQAVDRVFHMERSYFWKMRKPWVALKRLAGTKGE